MSDGVTVLPAKRIERSILPIQGQKVLLDAELADLYCVETRVVVQEAKRHAGRFPGDFMFRLEAEVLREVVDRDTGRVHECVEGKSWRRSVTPLRSEYRKT